MAIGSAVAIAVAPGCGRDATSVPSGITPPAGPSRTDGAIAGVVRLFQGGPPLAGVLVEVIEGSGTGTSAVTDAEGQYRLVVPTGSLRLRASKRGYETSETGRLELRSEGLTVEQVLWPGKWTVTGTVTDAKGAPLAGALLSLFVATRQEVYSAQASSDGAGRFALTTNAQPGAGYARAARAFYINQQVPFTCHAPADEPFAALCDNQEQLSVDVRMTGVVRVTLQAPTSLKVGESLAVRREIQLDDGRLLVDNGFNPTLSDDDVVWSRDPAIVRIVGRGDGIVWLSGIAVGATTIDTRFSGVSAALGVRVDP